MSFYFFVLFCINSVSFEAGLHLNLHWDINFTLMNTLTSLDLLLMRNLEGLKSADYFTNRILTGHLPRHKGYFALVFKQRGTHD